MNRMRRVAIALGLTMALSAGGCGSIPHVPNPLGPKKTCGLFDGHKAPKTAHDAERIARRMVGDVMGQPTVLRQEPFKAALDDDRWVVRSTPRPGELAGPFLIVIEAKTGCLLYMGAENP